jgi:antirestriction protein ArdC
MLSTKHGSSLSTTSRRNRITNEIIRKPNVVTNYNKYMGGVDRSDHKQCSQIIQVVEKGFFPCSCHYSAGCLHSILHWSSKWQYDPQIV